MTTPTDSERIAFLEKTAAEQSSQLLRLQTQIAALLLTRKPAPPEPAPSRLPNPFAGVIARIQVDKAKADFLDKMAEANRAISEASGIQQQRRFWTPWASYP